MRWFARLYSPTLSVSPFAYFRMSVCLSVGLFQIVSSCLCVCFRFCPSIRPSVCQYFLRAVLRMWFTTKMSTTFFDNVLLQRGCYLWRINAPFVRWPNRLHNKTDTSKSITNVRLTRCAGLSSINSNSCWLLIGTTWPPHHKISLVHIEPSDLRG